MCPIGNDKEKVDFRIDKHSDQLSRTHLRFSTQVPAESEDKIEDQPDVDVLQVAGAGKAVERRYVQGGQNHHDGQVGPYDCVKDLIRDPNVPTYLFTFVLNEANSLPSAMFCSKDSRY